MITSTSASTGNNVQNTSPTTISKKGLELNKPDNEQASYKPADSNHIKSASDFSDVPDITLEEYLKRKDTALDDEMKLLKALIKSTISAAQGSGICILEHDEEYYAYQALKEKNKELTKFEMTEEYSNYQKKLMLEHGEQHDIETIITIGEDKITIDYDKGITAPNKFQIIHRGININNILSILHASYGKENVEVETFEKGEGPTNAEFFEETTGKNYYRYVMSDGRF